MTANEDDDAIVAAGMAKMWERRDTSPRPVDLDAIDWRARHGEWCHPSDVRLMVAELRSARQRDREQCDEIRRLRAELRRLRASIGPDSERIRELEAALPGSDDIVVSREALDDALAYGRPAHCDVSNQYWHAHRSLRAALSQPHPAQEQQT